MAADLHCHSLFSVDGFATPEEVADTMFASGISTMALTDHNTLGGLARCRSRAEQLGLRFLTGVEFDGIFNGSKLDFLALGVDSGNASLKRLCSRQFAQYEINFVRLQPVFEQRYGVTQQRLLSGLGGRYRTHPAPVLNKWFAREFLLSEGVFVTELDAKMRMREIVAEAERNVAVPWKWADVGELLEIVHHAQGILLLAHVAKYRRGDLRAQLTLIEDLLEIGLDGFELYHPANVQEPHFHELVAEARRLSCAVSGGSDNHFFSSKDAVSQQRTIVPDWVTSTVEAAIARQARK